MEKPKQTVTPTELKRKIDDIMEEAKKDLRHPGPKAVLKTAASLFGAFVVTYFAGKRKGKRQARSSKLK